MPRRECCPGRKGAEVMVKQGLSDGGGIGVAGSGHSGPAKGKGRRINDDFFLEKACECKNIDLVELATCSSGPALRPIHPPEKNHPNLPVPCRLLTNASPCSYFSSFQFIHVFPVSPLPHQECLNAFELFKGRGKCECNNCSFRFTLCAPTFRKKSVMT